MELFDYFLDFISMVQKYEFYLYAFIFISIFAESAAFIGIVIPGELIVVFSGFIAFQGKIEYEICFLMIAAAAVLGDSAGYVFGKAAGITYFQKHKSILLLKERHVVKTLEIIQQEGIISILLGRITAGLRATTPFTAGISGMPYRQFILYNITGALVWTALFMAIGYLLGSGWMLIKVWFGKTGLFFSSVSMLVIGLAYLFWTAAKRPEDSVVISKYVVIIPPSFLIKFNVRYPLTAAFIGKRLAVDSYLGLNLTARIAICIILAWTFAEITADIIFTDPLVEFDREIVNKLSQFRSHSLTKLMIIFSNIGGEITQTTGVIFSIFYFSYKRKFDYLISYLAAMIGGSIMLIGLKAAIHRVRPLSPSAGDLIRAFGWSFPSGHSMLSLLFFGMLTYFLIRNTSSRTYRIVLAIAGPLMIFMIGLSRIYLQVHFLSDVLGGYAAGLFWLITCITALEIYREKKKTGGNDSVSDINIKEQGSSGSP